MVTVTAGEGCGKTYAVYSFLQRGPWDIIWVQLSERDNLGWRFWENYTGEVRRLNQEAGKILANLGFPETQPQFDRYMTYINEKIISRKSYVLVFDDVHLIKSRLVLNFMERALAVPVSKNHIVLISRLEPEINTIAFLAKGILSQITAEDLRFTEEETAGYFRLCRVPLEDGELARVYRDTEGWALAVGLSLQAIKARRAGGESRGEQVMDPIRKIVETIFLGMNGELQKFLIKLSLIEHWPRNFLDTLDPEGNNISAMEQQSALIRYDRYLHGYRIHHLFLEFLKEKQGELSPEEIQEIYAKGARWCVENNLPTDAAVDYERARDYEGLVRLIGSLPRIPPNTVASFFLEVLERLTAESGEEDGGNKELLFLRFIDRPRFLMCLGRFEESAEESRKAIKRFEALPSGPLRSRILSAAYNNLGSLILLTCRYTRNYNCAAYFERGYHYYLENPEPPGGQIGQCNLSSYIIQVGYPAGPGEIENALHVISPTITYASASMNGFLYGADTLAWAELAYYQGDLGKAEKFFRQAVYQGREKRQYEVENRGLFYLMRICIHTGNLAKIRELRRQLEAQLEIPEYLNRYTIHDIGMGRFYNQLGETGKIAPWLRDDGKEGELNFLFHNFNLLVKAQCLFAEKQYPQVLETLRQENGRQYLESFLLGKLEITALEAAARFRMGEEGAVAVLEEAYRIAAPNALDMAFIELGEDMRDFAGAVLAGKGCGIERSWLETIQVNASAYAKKLALAVRFLREEEGRPGMVFLNSKERTVLAGLSRGLTRKEIAQRGGLSVGTIKPLIKRVYDKLGAVNRADAIRIASSLGLLSQEKPPLVSRLNSYK